MRQVGDARKLERGAGTADGYLLLGPLYHLTERADRIAALREANRILNRGGTLVAAAITRFASLLDGLARGFIEDPEFLAILMNDVTSGQHRNPSGNPDYFTTAYFHRTEELEDELAEAGFRGAQVIAVQGPGWLRRDFDRHWENPDERRKLLSLIRTVESERPAGRQPAHRGGRQEELNGGGGRERQRVAGLSGLAAVTRSVRLKA